PFMSPLLKAISAQDYLEDVDLIIIDSESNDNTQKIAREFGAHVLTIKQKDFTHSKARNIASKLAKHEFLLFTVQDALPSDTTTFAKMAEILSKDENMAAVSTVQHARPDADIYARWQVNNHNELLDLTYDSISKVSDFSKFNQESFILKRRVSLLDDVCALYRKDTFDELNGFSEVGFGEDLDYAFKALRAGHSLGLLCSSGVIHSHNRPAHYFLKRTFISSYLDLDLLLDVDKKKIINPSIDLQAGLIIAEYLNSNDFNFQDNFFVNIRNFVYGWIYLHNDCDPTSALGQAIALIIRETKMSNKQLKGEEIINYYKNLMDILRSYLMSHPINIFNDENKRQFLERMLATQIGDILARYCLGRQTPTVAKNKKILTKLLSGNV
ncbi:glycosyltransferase, partial [Patescibacteria group bacterium]|nr:glycosyltransferase [Patescibacteria group bacterium]